MKKLLFPWWMIVLSSCGLILAEPLVVPSHVPLPKTTPYSLGQDTLALQSAHYDGSTVTKNVPQGQSLGVQWSSFGTSLENIDAALSIVKPQYFRVHLINGPCIRDNNCDTNEIGYGYGGKVRFSHALETRDTRIITFIQQGAKIFKNLATKYPDTTFLVSPELEHDLSIEAYRNAANAVLAVWPTVQLVNSPDGGIPSERYLGAKIERHGDGTQPGSGFGDADITSLDGAEATDVDVQAYLNRAPHAFLKFLWGRVVGNCRKDAAPFEMPRTRRTCPKGIQVEEQVHVSDIVPIPPHHLTLCKSILPFNAPWIWKPMAEHGPGVDPRADKPVGITKLTGQVIQVLASNGTQIGTIGFYGSYSPLNLWRHYSGWHGGSGFYGYDFEKKAASVSGSRYTWLRASNGVCAGPILTGRRNGSYR